MREIDSSVAAGDDTTERPAARLVWWTLRTAAAACLVCLLATQFLAGVTAPDTAARLKLARATASLPDPETTGSIGAARTTRLDPCAIPVRNTEASGTTSRRAAPAIDKRVP